MVLPRLIIVACLFVAAIGAAFAQAPVLPGTRPLTEKDDIAGRMVEGIHGYLDSELAACAARRAANWNRDITDAAGYERSVAPNRDHLAKLIGMMDTRDEVRMRLETDLADRARDHAGSGGRFRAHRVRWNVFRGVEGDGLLLVPVERVRADVITLPDCDTSPEMLAGLAPGIPAHAQFARRLAENGCRVLIPSLIDRGSNYSGTPGIAMTNQPHREFLYRAAYEMGRHIIGYEVAKVLAAVDWLSAEGRAPGKPARPIGIVGYGEGGLIALYSAALDKRIGAAVVSGYFAPRERMVREPIYRNVFGLLLEFGDAEIGSLIAPRALIIEASGGPIVTGPPQKGRSTAASGTLELLPIGSVREEFSRCVALTAGLAGAAPPLLTVSGDGAGPPGAAKTLEALLAALGIRAPLARVGPDRRPIDTKVDSAIDCEERRKRQFSQIAEDTQLLMRQSPERRREFWSRADFTSAERLAQTSSGYRDLFWNDVLGRLPAPTIPPDPRSKLVYDTPKFTGYEVKLDLYPGVFAYGILLVPKGIPAGERLPVVVCQHGLDGRSQDVADPATDSPYYHQFACRLAERGYVTFAPQNPYIGEDRFRTILRKAQPLKLTLFSFIVRQHEAILKWLGALPCVDPSRIALYGLSYGGKTAMRVPAALPGYCLSICSGDYNEWVWKCCSMDSPYSYLFTVEYDMPEWNLANTFNYAEMSWLIFPRPFMVERGHNDGVAPDNWVSYEYAGTRRVYDTLGLGAMTELEMFNGPHTIHGVGTFSFLDRHLKRPN